jgi:hypothetical protein
MIKLIAEVFTLDIPPKEKLLLLCMADNADMYGVGDPSVELLSATVLSQNAHCNGLLSGFQLMGL